MGTPAACTPECGSVGENGASQRHKLQEEDICLFLGQVCPKNPRCPFALIKCLPALDSLSQFFLSLLLVEQKEAGGPSFSPCWETGDPGSAPIFCGSSNRWRQV